MRQPSPGRCCITHSDRLARTADRAVLVDAGRITADGPPEQVLAHPVELQIHPAAG
jgi:ABC-type bacteriocin/lantibiotic exporter with double-glycine peptidase domain